MSFRLNKRSGRLAMLASLILVVSGCVPAPAQTPVDPTVIIVQYVTQVVATVTPQPPAGPTAVPPTKPAPAASGFDPYSVKPYYPISGCVASRLHPGDVAFVATGGEQMGIHYSRDVGFSPIARSLVPGELLYIIDNATCNRNGLVWEVLADSDNTHGFVIEGDGETYWVMPYGQTYDAKVIRDRLKGRN